MNPNCATVYYSINLSNIYRSAESEQQPKDPTRGAKVCIVSTLPPGSDPKFSYFPFSLVGWAKRILQPTNWDLVGGFGFGGRGSTERIV